MVTASRKPNLYAAANFIWRNARLLERHVFTHLFLDGEKAPVLEALRPYQNSDGGFGNSLEPDIRGPLSQPVPVEFAFRTLDQIDAFNDAMVRKACDYLLTITTTEGGVPFVLPSVRQYPRAPWWETEDDPSASVLPTASLAGLLHKHRVTHPWLEPATEFCWREIGTKKDIGGYELRAVLTFFQYVPDRERAETAFARLGSEMLERGLVALDPEEPGEVFKPLDFAPTPRSLVRALFADTLINAHLEALIALQQPDGGWPITWLVWTPAAELEWRACRTIEALGILRAYGRID